MVPCLQLVVPVGMGVEAQDMWLEAARMALADIPADILRNAATVAMQTADHPSKIVPAIVKAAREPMEWRRQNARYASQDAKPLALEKHAVSDEERKEVGVLMARLVQRLGDGPIA